MNLRQKTIGGVVVFIAIVFFSYALKQYTFVNTREITPAYFVDEIEHRDDLIKKLRDEGLISNSFAAGLVSRIYGVPEQIHPGGYYVGPHIGPIALAATLQDGPQIYVINFSRLHTDAALTAEIESALSWSGTGGEAFRVALRERRKERYLNGAVEYLAEQLKWNSTERAAFSEIATVGSTDLFQDMLPEANLAIDIIKTPEEIVGKIVGTLPEASSTFFEQYYDTFHRLRTERIVHDSMELLPDLVPIAASDFSLVEHENEIQLRFTTTYWNDGESALELAVKEEDAGILGDTGSDVYQHIFRTDGSHREHLAGHFLWHGVHVHYHFEDFIDYILIPSGGSITDRVGRRRKATFCVRDINVVAPEENDTPPNAIYEVCGRRKQGVSVGWGDTYYAHYGDQYIDVAGLKSGIYLLAFHVNPNKRFEESHYDNNWSTTVIDLDIENLSVKVIATSEGDHAPTGVK